MITYLYRRIVTSGWAPQYPDPEDCMGVLVRKARGTYVTMPTPINNLLLEAATKLNLITALTMRRNAGGYPRDSHAWSGRDQIRRQQSTADP